MALDLKVPQLQEVSISTGDTTVALEKVIYGKNASEFTEAELERRMEISRKLLPAHKFIPAEKPSLRTPEVEFFDLDRHWQKPSAVFERILKPIGMAVNKAFLKNVDKYPEGYNAYVHGPYAPFRYYGKGKM